MSDDFAPADLLLPGEVNAARTSKKADGCRTSSGRRSSGANGTANPEPTILGASKSGNVISGLGQDLRYGARALRKNPCFAFVAVLTLALGVGANTAVFSLANALLFRTPEGVHQPEEVVQLGRSINGSDFSTFSYPDYVDCRDQNTSFVDLATYRQTEIYLTTEGTAERLSGILVSGNYFRALGTRADAGQL